MSSADDFAVADDDGADGNFGLLLAFGGKVESETHVFLVDGGTVRTSHTVACPEGITRATILQLCRDHEIPSEVADLSLTDVYRADEMFCTGTMGELVAVLKVDGRTIGSGEPGEVTARLRSLFADLTAHQGVPIVSP